MSHEGGTLPLDVDAARGQLRARERAAELDPLEVRRATYPAAYDSVLNVPSGPAAGLGLVVGRCFVEVRSATNAAGDGRLEVSLLATRQGLRATVKSLDTTGAESALTAGDAVFWIYDEATGEWSQTAIEALQAGARVATADRVIAVGAR